MLATNFIPFTIFVLFYRIVAIFKYSGYSETVKLGGVTNLVETTSAWHVLKGETSKRNDRNETAETIETTETTETKRPKRNNRNETTETKRPKRNDRNETAENINYRKNGKY